MKYLKAFNAHDDYLTYIVGSEFKNLKYDSVSYCIQQNNVHFNKYVPETKLVCKYNVTSISEPTTLRTNYENNIFKSMEIDDVMLDELVTEYTFDMIGVHTVKYELYDETKLGNQAPVFFNINLVECIIPDSVTSINNLAFYNCSNFTSITIGNNVTSIGMSAFNNCSSLTSIDIPNSVTSIGTSAFVNCSGLTSINIPSGVTSIGSTAFANCSGLTSIDIPSGVTSIGSNAFGSCTSLTSCTIGSGVTSIGNQAFENCTSLTSIVSNATTAPTISSNTFQGIKTGGTLRVPSGSSGYDVWMGTDDYYLGKYNWTKVEQ